MSWTEKEVGDFQSVNNKAIAEINATLRPDTVKGTGKIGIFCHGQVGDMATCMSVLKYRQELWAGKEIVWFVNSPNADLLRYAPINEIRPWVWAGNGLPEGTPDFYPLLCNADNRLNKELAKNYALTADLEDGYFPCPHMMTPEQRHGIDYPNVSRKVFGIGADREWHPYLSFSEYEKETIKIDTGRKTIMLETFCGSGQSKWADDMTIKTMEILRKKWGQCNFLFASHKNHDQFKHEDGYFSCANLTPRQTALLINYCDLFVGISSGLSVCTSYWGSKPVPKIQYCGSFICSTVALATGEISLITSDNFNRGETVKEFYDKLKEVISRIQ